MRAFVTLAFTHPWMLWLALSLLALAIQVAIDVVMGDAAEYFNAARVFAAWRELLAGRDPLAVSFLAGQLRLGALALPLGTAILFVQPLVYGGLLFLGIRLLHRLI